MENRQEVEQRILLLQQKLQEQQLDGALFFHTEDVYYFSGTGVNSVLLVPSNGKPIQLIRINVEKGKNDSFIEDIRRSTGLKTVKETVLEVFGDRKIRLGLSFDVISLSFFQQWRRQLTNVEFHDVQKTVWSLRTIKSPWEISQIKAAAEISCKSLGEAIGYLESGISEIQFQKTIELVKSRFGDDGTMLQRADRNRLPFGVAVFGKNTGIISGNWITMTGEGISPGRPYGAGHYQLTEGDLVVIDHGTVFQGYHADEARTFLYGKKDHRKKYYHDILNDILEETIDFIRPGLSISEVYLKAEQKAASYGLKDQFMGLDQYGFRYLGHGVGLEIDEPPLISALSQQEVKHGMVLALEPKFIFKNEFGLTQEDTIVVTDTGCEVITHFPRGRFEV